MADLYQDQVKKLAYYRSRIIQDLARKGIYPDDAKINARLNDIDTMLGVFQYMNIEAGDTFDAAKFNEDFERIYRDLRILYELAYEISVQEYNELKVYCETHLNELQNMASNYQYKTKFELDSTYLGSTVFFQSAGFNSSMSNGIATINLGKIQVEEQSKLACIFSAENVNPRNVVFTFSDSNGINHNCSPYDYNQDFFTVPGILKKNTYEVSLLDSMTKTQFICTPSEIAGNVNHNNKYVLFGGKGFVQTGYYSKGYFEKIAGVPITIEQGVVQFYVLNGTYINFDFSETPSNKNFEGIGITDMTNCQKIVIEHNSTLTFDFITNGTIYATKHNGKILNGEIYYPVPEQVRDVLVEEYSVGDKVSYDVTVTAGPFLTGDVPVIDTIAIKQLSVLEDVP